MALHGDADSLRTLAAESFVYNLKFDDNSDGDVFVKLFVFCVCGIKSVFTSSLSLLCATHAEHVFRFESNVFMLGSMTIIVPHMQGKSIPKRNLPMIKHNSISGGYSRQGEFPTRVEKTSVAKPFLSCCF
jgi:hypothetical protein